MPYKLSNTGCPEGKFGVVNETTGQQKGCSDTLEMAKAHMAKLYSVENKEFEDVVAEAEQYLKELPSSETIDQEYDVSYTWEMNGITSFAELDAAVNAGDLGEDMLKLTTVYRDLLDNIFNPMPSVDGTQPDQQDQVRKLTDEFAQRVNGLIDDYKNNQTAATTGKAFVKALFSTKEAAFQTRGGKKFHAGDFFYVPDAKKPSTWKLLKTGTPGGAPDHVHVGQALSALSSNPAHGKGADIPAGEKAAVRAKVVAAWKKLNPGKEVPKETKMMIWKDKEGQYRWFGTYSNNFRDRDKEIISQKSHERFVELVDNKEVDFPVLMHWHMKEFTWGQADMVAYDEDSGMAMASGYVLPGHEAEAEAMINSKKEIRMSHGMPPSSMKYDPADKSVIIEHVTKEVSDLPAWAAANELTSFSVIDVEQYAKEASNMTIPDAKRKYLKEQGLTDEAIDSVLNANKAVADAALAEGVDTKDNGATTEPVKTEEAAKPPEETPETPAAPAAEPVAPVKPDETAAKELAAAVAQILSPVLDQVKALNDRIDAMETQKKEAAEAEQNLTPALSLAARLVQSMSAVGNKDTFVAANKELAKDKPAEEQPIDKNETGDPMKDAITRIISGKSLGG